MSTNSLFTIKLGLIVSLLSITGQAANSSASPTLATGMTVATTGNISVWSTPSTGNKSIGEEAQGNQGTVIGGPESADSITWWEVSFNDDLTGWTTQGGLEAASSTAPTLSFSASPASIAPGAVSTLSWSSNDAIACTGTGFTSLGASGQYSVTPGETTTYAISCTNGFGSTSRSVSVNVSPFPGMSWTQSLPVIFNNPAIVPFGGTETRALVFMDGSLYAGIGDWEDAELANSQTPGAQVLRLDSPNGSWVEDKDFNEVVPSTGKKDYEAIAMLGTAHFDHDSGNNPITPVDVLMAGFWNLGMDGLPVWEKTVTTGSVGAQGTWTKIWLEPPPASGNSEVRSFTSYTDSVTNVEMAFAGSDPFGIFSGAFDSSTNSIAWGATAEAGTVNVTTGGDRVMSFAACGGKLYASMYDAILVRTDGTSPSWQIYYQYSGPALSSHSSGFRGLTCVPNLNGAGSMLISALEGPGDIYDIPLDGSQATIELHTSNYIASQLDNWVDYVIGSYNNMVVYPESGTTSCPDHILGLGLIYMPNYANDFEGYHPNASYVVRHCNGTYTYLNTIAVPGLNPSLPLLSARTIVVSQFSSDPAGTLYVGGYDAHTEPAHNTDWIYRGVPQTGTASTTSSSTQVASRSHN
jgi:hypothetical protein